MDDGVKQADEKEKEEGWEVNVCGVFFSFLSEHPRW